LSLYIQYLFSRNFHYFIRFSKTFTNHYKLLLSFLASTIQFFNIKFAEHFNKEIVKDHDNRFRKIHCHTILLLVQKKFLLGDHERSVNWWKTIPLRKSVNNKYIDILPSVVQDCLCSIIYGLFKNTFVLFLKFLLISLCTIKQFFLFRFVSNLRPVSWVRKSIVKGYVYSSWPWQSIIVQLTVFYPCS